MVKEYCEMCKRYHERGLCDFERTVGILTGSTAFAVQLMERNQRIDEAVRWLTTDSLGTPQGRANKAVEILKGITPTGQGMSKECSKHVWGIGYIAYEGGMLFYVDETTEGFDRFEYFSYCPACGDKLPPAPTGEKQQ